MLPKLSSLTKLTGLGLHDSSLTDDDLQDYMGDLEALDLEFLNISGNNLSDPQTLIGLSRITTIQRLAINDNEFSGELPRTLTRLTFMLLFYFHDNAGLCAPADDDFQDWLRGSPEVREYLRGGYPDVKRRHLHQRQPRPGARSIIQSVRPVRGAAIHIRRRSLRIRRITPVVAQP